MARLLMLHERHGTAGLLGHLLALGDTLDVAASGGEATALLETGEYAACVADVAFPDDVATLEEVRRLQPRLPLVACVHAECVEKAAPLAQLKVDAILTAPVTKEGLQAALLPLVGGPGARRAVLASQIDAYLHKHFREPGLTAARVAQRCRVRLRTLHRLFSEHLGTTFGERLSSLRVREAKKFLAQTDEPQKRVAARCGYAGERGLAGAIRRATGLSPGAYLKQFRP